MFQTAKGGYFLKRRGIQLHLHMQETEFEGRFFYAYYVAALSESNATVTKQCHSVLQKECDI